MSEDPANDEVIYIRTSSIWPHSPEHRLQESGAYMITAGTYGKVHFFHQASHLDALSAGLKKYSRKHGLSLQAWALFPNHYHLIVHGAGNPSEAVLKFIKEFHACSARWLNRIDQTLGRRVWYNYWDSHLTLETSYYARLNYVHQNAVHHGLVKIANQYPWCSASWFEDTAPTSFMKTVYRFRTDRVHVMDDY